MSDPATLVVTSTPDPNEPEALQHYVLSVVPLLLGLGGKIVKRSSIFQTIHGKQTFTTLLVTGFPSREILGDFFCQRNIRRNTPVKCRHPAKQS